MNELQHTIPTGAGPRRRPGRPRFPVDETILGRCRATGRLTNELCRIRADEDRLTSFVRAPGSCHARQIAMYIAHVVLSMPFGVIASAFDRDRTTVAHACRVVEERRDDPGYDRFVEQCERCVAAALLPDGRDGDDQPN